jgi:hypothetical protein
VASGIRSEDRDGRALQGAWVNESGAVLDLTVHRDGRVSGTLKPGRSTWSRHPRRLIGRYLCEDHTAKGVVASVFGWPEAGSVTVWCGQLDPVAGVLRTEWLAATLGDQPNAPVSKMTSRLVPGHTVFRRRWRRSPARSVA